MIYALLNQNNQLIRSVLWKSNELLVVRSKATGRIHFVDNLDRFESGAEEFDILQRLKPTDIKENGLQIDGVGTILAMDEALPKVADATASEEEDDRFPFFFKWSTVGYIGAVGLLLIGTWIANRFFSPENEPIVVQVVKQTRPQVKTPTVNVSPKKVTRANRTRKASNRNVVARNSQRKTNPKRVTRSNSRPTPQNLRSMGALGALGGMTKDSRGSGGLNLNKANGSGLGYAGAAKRGGHERGLVGKGLVAAGVGNNSQVKGYGGLGTKGLGGGQAGYGTMKIGGSSAAFFQPLSEESLIEGGLDRDQINAVIQRNRGQVTYCYERGLQKDPGLSGRVEIKFVIDPFGRVSAANVAHTSLSARQVENCIVSKLRGWKFPNPVGNVNVRVTYPFLLQRVSQG